MYLLPKEIDRYPNLVSDAPSHPLQPVSVSSARRMRTHVPLSCLASAAEVRRRWGKSTCSRLSSTQPSLKKVSPTNQREYGILNSSRATLYVIWSMFAIRKALSHFAPS